MRDYVSSVFNSGNTSSSSATTSSARERQRTRHPPRPSSLHSSTRDGSAQTTPSSPSTTPSVAPSRRRFRDRLATLRRGRSTRHRGSATDSSTAEGGGGLGLGQSYVIWVIGGYYPEEMVNTLVPHFMLGQFDHEDFW